MYNVEIVKIYLISQNFKLRLSENTRNRRVRKETKKWQKRKQYLLTQD